MASTENNEFVDQDEDKTRISFTCERDGLFASREHCNQYFECWRGQLAFRTCPPGLHFNKKEKRCDKPCKAKCDPKICKYLLLYIILFIYFYKSYDYKRHTVK